MNTQVVTQNIKQLNEELEVAIKQRDAAAQDYQETVIYWGRGLTTDDDVKEAADWLDACEAEVQRSTAAQERAAQKSKYYHGLLGR